MKSDCMAKIKAGAVANVGLPERDCEGALHGCAFLPEGFWFSLHGNMGFFSSPSFVLSSSRYVLVALAQQHCARLPAGGKCFPC